jgi:hypothetical protein
MMLSSYDSWELAQTLVVGKNYRMTVTDCCIGGVEFQGKLVSKDKDDLVFINGNGDRATLYTWALPGDLEEIR